MKHPNQSFIDNFNRPTKSDDRTPTYLYGSQYTEKKRKEKFQYFVESLNQPKTLKNESLTQAISKIFDYNTLSQNKNKLILEAKQSLGSLPEQFVYNGLLYSFNKKFNAFVNQHGHVISIEQATAFMDMSEFEEVGATSSESDTDGGAFKPQPSVAAVPETPSGLTAISISSTGATLNWQDNSVTETEFKIYFRDTPIPPPLTPTNLIANNINTSGVTLTWQDNSTDESQFRVYYRNT